MTELTILSPPSHPPLYKGVTEIVDGERRRRLSGMTLITEVLRFALCLILGVELFLLVALVSG